MVIEVTNSVAHTKCAQVIRIEPILRVRFIVDLPLLRPIKVSSHYQLDARVVVFIKVVSKINSLRYRLAPGQQRNRSTCTYAGRSVSLVSGNIEGFISISIRCDSAYAGRSVTLVAGNIEGFISISIRCDSAYAGRSVSLVSGNIEGFISAPTQVDLCPWWPVILRDSLASQLHVIAPTLFDLCPWCPVILRDS